MTHTDLLDIIAATSDLAELPEQSVAVRACIQCGRETNAYYVINKDAVCVACCDARRVEG